MKNRPAESGSHVPSTKTGLHGERKTSIVLLQSNP